MNVETASQLLANSEPEPCVEEIVIDGAQDGGTSTVSEFALTSALLIRMR